MVCTSLMNMVETLVVGPNPQAPLAIAEQALRAKRLRDARQLVPVQRAVDEPPNSVPAAQQQRAVFGVIEGVNAVPFAGHGVEFRRIRLPPPQAVAHSRPQPASRVLIQAEHSQTQPAVFSVAANMTVLNRAE